MTSGLTSAIDTLLKVFHKYASMDCKEGKEKDCKGDHCMDRFKLSKHELKELVNKELNMDNVNDPEKLDELMKELDDDCDGQVNFFEFVTLVVGITCACNAFMESLMAEQHDHKK